MKAHQTMQKMFAALKAPPAFPTSSNGLALTIGTTDRDSWHHFTAAHQPSETVSTASSTTTCRLSSSTVF